MNRRLRHIAGLKPWADARPIYRLKIGPAPIHFDVLTDEALADLRSRIARDVRSERRRQSESRAINARVSRQICREIVDWRGAGAR